ncbi:MAG: hypothetical protein M3Y87_19580 [Myxococcota bacterium]|nr:hypothetical protein [Myxococcota bacterium]
MSSAIEALYRDPNGMLVQCSHCRRVRRGDPSVTAWDWVPEYVARPQPRTSHGLCAVCLDFYYPK